MPSPNQDLDLPADALTPAELERVHDVWLESGAVLDWARAFRKAFDPAEGRAIKVGYFRWIDPDDLEAMREWAVGMCRGCTVSELAADLGVAAERSAVLEHLTRGFESAATREVVREACEQELAKAEAGGRPAGA